MHFSPVIGHFPQVLAIYLCLLPHSKSLETWTTYWHVLHGEISSSELALVLQNVADCLLDVNLICIEINVRVQLPTPTSWAAKPIEIRHSL